MDITEKRCFKSSAFELGANLICLKKILYFLNKCIYLIHICPNILFKELF